MDGIISLLPPPFYQQVEALWDELEDSFALKGVRITPFPHFSWQIAENYDQAGLALTLKQIAARGIEFMAQTSGLGIFSSPQPTLYIALVRNPLLTRFHQQVWKAVEPLSTGASPYYRADNWVPHITIAYLDLTPQNIGALIQNLAFREFNWQFAVNNVGYISQASGVGELKFKI